MQNCQSCSNQVSERAVFCGSCSKQVRCKACNDFLEFNAQACVSCGTLIGQGDPTIRQHVPVTMNTFLLNENQKNRSVELCFSDTAVVNLGDILTYIGANRIGKRGPAPQSARTADSQLLLPTGLGESEEHQSTPEAEPIPHATIKLAGGDKESLREVFAQDGERLVLDNLKLKATSQLDAARRIVYLFLYAHELEGHQQVSREAINAALKDVALYDPNIANWISTSSDLRESIEDGQPLFRLRKTGRDEARKILAEVLNPEVSDAWSLVDRSRSRGKGSGEPGSVEKHRTSRGTKKATEVDDWATKWTSSSSGIDGHSIVEAAASLTKAVFGLWAIRRATDDKVTIVSKRRLSAFIHKAFVVKVAPSTLQHALESKTAKGKVIRVRGGYEITPTGMKEAAALAGLEKSTAASAGKG